MSMKKHGWIQATPTQYLLHYRRGRIIRQGMGLGAFCLPVIDHCTVIPCTAHNLTFAADQITQENQGVEIAGFAVWKIARPELTAQRFDFEDPEQPTKAIGVCLKDVVESAIRHRLANMTIEETLRKRASIILELKKELDYITDQWGLSIDTIEIKHVRIMSNEVFSNLQAAYREDLRMESETNRLRAEKEITLRRLNQQEELSQHEAAIKAKQLALEHELQQQKNQLKYEEEITATRHQREMCEQEYIQQIATYEAEIPMLLSWSKTEEVRRANEAASLRHDEAMAQVKANAVKYGAEADNVRRADLALIAALPSVAEKLELGEVNITPDLIQGLSNLFRLENRKVA